MSKNTVFSALVLLALCSHAFAGTLKLETSVVIVSADSGEGTMSIKNEDTVPLLLITRLENLPEDPENLLLVTPPVARIDPTNSQVVRFLLKKTAVLKTERMMRVNFESVAPKSLGNVRLGINQNISVIIRPKELPHDDQPWKHLRWHIDGGKITVTNPSSYVVRLLQQVQLLPTGTATLPRTYVLPGENLTIPVTPAAKSATQVKILPVSLYGYILPAYETELSPQ